MADDVWLVDGPATRVAGNRDPDGAMPRDTRARFSDRAALKRDVEGMIG